MVELEHARALLDSMRLKMAAELLDAQLERSLKAEDTYLAFLLALLALEETERRRRGEEMRIKLSRLPHRKTLDEFDFDFQPSIDKRQIDELATLAFAARAENVILLGPPGVGKTHLAVGLATQALKAGLAVYYASLAQLIADLKKAQEQNRLERRWRVYLRPDILIIDEVGYLQLDRTEAQLLPNRLILLHYFFNLFGLYYGFPNNYRCATTLRLPLTLTLYAYDGVAVIPTRKSGQGFLSLDRSFAVLCYLRDS